MVYCRFVRSSRKQENVRLCRLNGSLHLQVTSPIRPGSELLFAQEDNEDCPEESEHINEPQRELIPSTQAASGDCMPKDSVKSPVETRDELTIHTKEISASTKSPLSSSQPEGLVVTPQPKESSLGTPEIERTEPAVTPEEEAMSPLAPEPEGAKLSLNAGLAENGSTSTATEETTPEQSSAIKTQSTGVYSSPQSKKYSHCLTLSLGYR